MFTISGTPELRLLYDTWNRYTPDKYFGIIADYSGPVLMLNGNLDNQTPMQWADLASRHFQGQDQVG